MKPIPIEDFFSRTGIDKETLGFNRIEGAETVVSLRDIARVEMVNAMSNTYLARLLSSVRLLGHPSLKVFEGCGFSCVRIDPSELLLGQRFVYRPNYISILENFKDLFREFSLSRGISKLTALVVLGKDREGKRALAHYVPPTIEIHRGKKVLMDGVHRNFIIKNSGTTIESIVIEDPIAPFPCSYRSWDEIGVVDEKPPKFEDRFFDVRQDFFRDLKSVGIDG